MKTGQMVEELDHAVQLHLESPQKVRFRMQQRRDFSFPPLGLVLRLAHPLCSTDLNFY